MNNISLELIEEFENDFYHSNSNIIAMNSVITNGINNSSFNNLEKIKKQNHYSIEIKTGDITNQKQSGRCWIFAALNFLRLEAMKKLNLKTFELSQNYLLFYDKLEKANYFIENIIQTRTLDIDDRLISHLLTDPMCDGGQWDMFVNLVNKYGVVPKEVMPETASSSNTQELDRYLTMKLREYACQIRKCTNDDLVNMKKDMLRTIYRILAIALGIPPTKFTFETMDKDDKFIRIENTTPKEFYDKYINMNLQNYVSIINAPTKDKPYNKTYTVEYLGNVIEGKEIKYLNLKIDRLKELTIEQMKNNEAVWFGSDVSQFSINQDGILSSKVFNVDKTFDTNFSMTKEEKLDYKESFLNHAMLFVGVNVLDDQTADRFKVENSWGKEKGKEGYYIMDADWFDNYVYEVVINKRYLSNEEISWYEQEPIKLKPWDPMGSLAK